MSLHNMPKSDIQQMLENLRNSPWNFYLTGSRFFSPRNITLETDYDFFTDSECEEFLISLGFRQLSNSEYKDSLTSAVYRWSGSISHIDIQIVTNLEVKQLAQVVLQNNRWCNLLGASKSTRKNYWNLVVNAIESTLTKRGIK